MTKYIVNNATGQTIVGGLTISGGTQILSQVPTTLSGSTGDKQGQIAFDGRYLYYCTADYVPVGYMISGGGTTYVFNESSSLDWNSYYSPPVNYGLQTGYVNTGDESFSPQVGWYFVDNNYQVKQVVSGYTGPTIEPNGSGYLMSVDGEFSISSEQPTLTFYTSEPSVTYSDGIGEIWKTVNLYPGLNKENTYKALLTQTEPITGVNLGFFNDGFIIGERYTITNYSQNDDFSNVANVIAGVINETDCQFIATGTTPTSWSNGSEVTSAGSFVVTELENTLGYELTWELFSDGAYIAFPTVIGPKYNNFNKETTIVTSQMTINNNPISLNTIKYFSGPGSFGSKDDVIGLFVWDTDLNLGANNTLFYTPIILTVNEDFDETPVVLTGEILGGFPNSYASTELFCDSNSIEVFIGDNRVYNDIPELVNLLNTNDQTNFLGVYSDDGLGSIELTMPRKLVTRFCSSGTLTFRIFND